MTISANKTKPTPLYHRKHLTHSVSANVCTMKDSLQPSFDGVYKATRARNDSKQQHNKLDIVSTTVFGLSRMIDNLISLGFVYQALSLSFVHSLSCKSLVKRTKYNSPIKPARFLFKNYSRQIVHSRETLHAVLGCALKIPA